MDFETIFENIGHESGGFARKKPEVENLVMLSL
jgi:hypothetical protein